MADHWYYANDEEKLGPFSSGQLRELADAGRLLPSDTVWKEGIERGVRAAKVKNLFMLPQGESPAIPESTPAPEALSACAPAQTMAPVADVVQETPPLPPPLENPEPALQTNIAEEQKPQSKKVPNQNQLVTKRTFRVVGSKGAVILGQDGVSVRYRGKCPKCGYEGSSMKTMGLRTGVNRDRFFCEKCRKLQQVEIYGAS